jgi:hypothetical protein
MIAVLHAHGNFVEVQKVPFPLAGLSKQLLTFEDCERLRTF